MLGRLALIDTARLREANRACQGDTRKHPNPLTRAAPRDKPPARGPPSATRSKGRPLRGAARPGLGTGALAWAQGAFVWPAGCNRHGASPGGELALPGRHPEASKPLDTSRPKGQTPCPGTALGHKDQGGGPYAAQPDRSLGSGALACDRGMMSRAASCLIRTVVALPLRSQRPRAEAHIYYR